MFRQPIHEWVNPIPFLVPIILSMHIPLGACFEPVSLNVPAGFSAFAHYGFSYFEFLLNHTDHAFASVYISTDLSFRPVPSQVRQSSRTFSPWVFYRPPAYRQHFYLSRLSSALPVRATLCRLHRASDASAFAYIRQSEYQGRRFGALLLHSTYRIISSTFAGCRFFIFSDL